MSDPAPAYLSAPTAPSDRIELLDVVRGFALFGVLMLNMLSFSGPVADFAPWAVSTTWWDRTAELLIRAFGEAAFYSTFSFLFGLGFALQLERARARGEQLTWRFVNRLVILAGFGLIHTFLIWDGDILLQYAVAGLLLPLFSRASARTVGWWSVGLLTASLVLTGALFGSAAAFIDPLDPTEITDNLALYRDGGFGDIVGDRTDGWLGTLIVTVAGTPWLLGIFLIGVWVVRTGKLAGWREQGAFARQVIRRALPVAVVGKGLLILFMAIGWEEGSGTLGMWLSIFVGGPALGMVYTSLLVLLFQRLDRSTGAAGTRATTTPNTGSADHPVRLFGPVGRMALTNYLMQSTVMVLVFYGFGLGQYGRFGVATTFCLTVAFFAAQIVFSRWWLARFSYGPMEWLWRTLTYRAPLPGGRTSAGLDPTAR